MIHNDSGFKIMKILFTEPKYLPQERKNNKARTTSIRLLMIQQHIFLIVLRNIASVI